MRLPASGLAALLIATARCAPPQAHTPTLSGLAALQALADSGQELPRPRLPAGADTNAASAYFEFGERLVRWNTHLDTAEMALYWASRLDPTAAEPLYARSLITLRALRNDGLATWLRTRSMRAAHSVTLTARQIHRIDSLQRIAWHRNPFLFSDLEFEPLSPRRSGDPRYDGWHEFAGRRFGAAESLFAVALQKNPEEVGLRIYRARALFYLGRYTAAVAELEAARDTVRRSSEARLSPFIVSVEMFEFAIGIVRVHQDDFPAARAAFERALIENLGFYWAHVRLAGSALALRDTATALAELDIATQLEGRDPALRLYYGAVLQSAGRLAEAETHLRRAIELDPFYAIPYYLLAVNYHTRSDTTTAIDHYRQFLSRAARDDPNRPSASRALAALGGTVPEFR